MFYRGGMATVWVLHTETKGTGAQMVPLERVTKRSPAAEPVFVARKRVRAPKPEESKPRPARRFKIVDVMTRQALAEDVSTRDAADALGGVRSIVDVNVYVWLEEDARWRLVTFAEQRTLWDLARRDAD